LKKGNTGTEREPGVLKGENREGAPHNALPLAGKNVEKSRAFVEKDWGGVYWEGMGETLWGRKKKKPKRKARENDTKNQQRTKKQTLNEIEPTRNSKVQSKKTDWQRRRKNGKRRPHIVHHGK